MGGTAAQLGGPPASRQRRFPALAGTGGRRGELGLVDGGERGLGGAQALGGLDRGAGLHRERCRLGREPIGELALARGLGGDIGESLCQRIAPRAEALDRRGERDAVRGSRLLLAEDARQLLLRGGAARGDLGDARGCGVALLARDGELALALAAGTARLGQRGGEQAETDLGDLPPERLGALGSGRLQLERLETGAQLALDVPGSFEVGGDARELGLGALPAALELSEPCGLLDEAAALVRPREQHLIDGALGDDAVQLAAEPGLREEVAHVEAADGLAVEQVVAVARAVEPAHDRELAARDADAAVAVVEHQLDLADAARRVLLGAREEHVLARLRADLAGRLRCHGPLQRVGDVRLARAVRPDDDGDPALEAQLDRIAERLEAAQTDRAQVHSRPSLSMRSSASWAAACSEAFLEGPSPVPRISSPSIAAEVKLRRCAGPVASIRA